MSGRRPVFVVGLDAATFDLVQPFVDAGHMPTLARLMANGVRAPLRSTLPALTPPGWTSAATGRNPGKHNIFNFYKTTGSSNGGRGPVTLADLRSPRVWDIAADAGLRTCVLHMPLTYPPRATGGVMISGIMTPKGAPDFVAPAELKVELEARIPGYRMEVDESALKRADLDAFRDDAFDLQRVQTAEVLHLLEHERWDLFWVMFHTLDKLQHFYWKYMDPGHPAHPGPGPYQHVIRDFHAAFDRSLAQFLERVPQDAHVVVLSDHGSAPLHQYFCVMTWLVGNGFMSLQPEGVAQRGLAATGIDARTLVRRLKGVGLGWMPKLVPRALKSAVPQTLTGFGKVAHRIDWSRTRAYCPSAPGSGLFINVKGREPHGIVSPGREYDAVADELRERLLRFRDPRTGEPIVTHVHRREDVYRGPYCTEGPDLLIETAHTVCMVEGLGRTALLPAGTGADERTGNHARDGILVLHGPEVRRGVSAPLANIEDVGTTVLHLLGLPVDADMDGAVLVSALEPASVAARPVATTDRPYTMEAADHRFSEDEEARIQDMLEGLGYV